MWPSTPISDDEVARRKAIGAALWAQKHFPPLYRVSSMDPETVLHGSFGSSPVKTHYVFAGENDFRRPRLEVHSLEPDAVEASILWQLNFGGAVPEPAAQSKPVSVTVSGSPVSGELVATSSDGWMISVRAPDVALVVTGPGELPRPLALEPVDMEALKRSEFRNSGVAEI